VSWLTAICPDKAVRREVRIENLQDQGSPCRGVHSFVGRKESVWPIGINQTTPDNRIFSSDVYGKRQAGHTRSVDCLVRASLACLHKGCIIF